MSATPSHLVVRVKLTYLVVIYSCLKNLTSVNVNDANILLLSFTFYKIGLISYFVKQCENTGKPTNIYSSKSKLFI